MASILNTDLGELYDHWGQRVAFNEGYERQKITEARQAGAAAFHNGVDRKEARELYFDARDQRVAEAKEFLHSEPIAIEDAGVQYDDIQTITEVTDGEVTLGMESCVAAETEDFDDVLLSDCHEAQIEEDTSFPNNYGCLWRD